MLNTVRAIFKEGKIQLLEEMDLPEGTEMLVTPLLDEKDFAPPPKVKSAVLRFKRKEIQQLGCDEKSFFKIREKLRSITWQII